MAQSLKTFAVISPDRSYGDRLCCDLLSLCRANGCNFLFRVFTDVSEAQSCAGLDTFTHIILVLETGGGRVVRELRSAAVRAPIMLLTKSPSDMVALFRQANTYCANPPRYKADFAYIMNLLYGSENRFLPEGRHLQILPTPQCADCKE